MRVTINAGHMPGQDSGAVGQTGLQEADVTKSVSLLLCDLLKSQHEVQFVQANELQDICDLSNEWQSDYFISIHCNAAENPAANGFEIWTTFGETKSDELAECIYTEMLTLPLNGRNDTSDGDSDKESNFYVLRHTDCPAVLIELAFISNEQEESLLASSGFQQKVAEAIVKGILKV